MKKYNILIIDDDDMVANSIRDSLELLKIYNPTVVNSGENALKKVKKINFDAYLVDQIMPEMTGVEFIIKLLSIVEEPLVYIITAEDDDIALNLAEKSIEQGGLPIKRYIRKPWPHSLFTVDLREDLREQDLRKSLLKTLKVYSTEQKCVQKNLTSAQKNISQLEKQQAATAGGITVIKAAHHEINNINAALSGGAMQLKNLINNISGNINEEDLKNLNLKIIMFENLSKRLKDYTDFLGSLHEKIEEPKQSLDVQKILTLALSDIQDETDCTKVKIIKHFDPGTIAFGYPNQLHNAFYQILKNGIEAMSYNGILTITIQSLPTKILIKIQDTGRGIHKNSIENIFVPLFTQTKIYGGKGGSIAYKIITDNHKGRIQIESYTCEMIESGFYKDKAVGTIVTIFLPL